MLMVIVFIIVSVLYLIASSVFLAGHYLSIKVFIKNIEKGKYVIVNQGLKPDLLMLLMIGSVFVLYSNYLKDPEFISGLPVAINLTLLSGIIISLSFRVLFGNGKRNLIFVETGWWLVRSGWVLSQYPLMFLIIYRYFS